MFEYQKKTVTKKRYNVFTLLSFYGAHGNGFNLLCQCASYTCKLKHVDKFKLVSK